MLDSDFERKLAAALAQRLPRVHVAHAASEPEPDPPLPADTAPLPLAA